MTIKVTYNVTDVYVSETISATYINISYESPSSGGGVWGSITGTLSNQTDLQNALNSKFDDPTGTTSQYLRGDGTLATFPTIPSGTVTSVGLTMPSAFSVANSPVTSSGTLAVTGAGTASQYIRGDGQLANFPDNLGGGSSVNYYLNGSVTQGTFGGDTYYQMSKTPVLGAGTNFTRTNAQGNGYIASFITDAGDPSLLNIPAGNWNVEFYFQANSNAGNPQFYAELYKVDASNNFTLVGSGSTNPEGITNGTTIDQYYTAIPVPQTSLLVTDRLAIRIFVITSGRTITLHTENSNLCEVLTTLSTGLNALNGLTAQVQYFATGTSGTDFAISSATDTHTFNLPTASATNRGALSSADWATFNNKQNALTNPITGTGTSGQVAYFTGATTQAGSNNLFWDNTNGKLGIGTNTPAQGLSIIRNENTSSGIETQNTSTGAAANSGIIVRNSASAGQLFKLSTGYVTYKTLVANDLGFYNGTSGDISLLNDVAAGKIKFTTGTSSTAQMTLTAAGRLLIGTTTESTFILDVVGTARITGALTANSFIPSAATVPTNGMYLGAANTLTFATNSAEKVRIDANGSVGIGSTSLTSYGLRVGKTIVGALSSTGIYQDGTVQSTVTSNAFGFYNSARTQAAAFTLSNYYHYYADQFGLGAGSTVTNQYGFFADSTLVGATNDYGFYGNLAAGTNVWNLYMNGTANNYMAGSLGIGGTNLTARSLLIGRTVTGATTGYGILQSTTYASDVTASGINNYSLITTAAATYTLTNAYNYFVADLTKGAGSTITNQFGYYSANLTQGTNNFGFYSDIASTSGRWNFYAAGTALNYFNGNLLIGSTSDTGEKLQVTGTAKIGGNLGGSNQRVANFRNIGGNAFIELQSSGSGAVGLWTASGNEFGIYQNATAGTIGTSVFYINSSGNVGVNTFSINASAKLQVDSTTQGILPPRMTTTQKNAIATPSAGLMVYDTTLNKLCVFTTAWETITSI